MYLRNTYCWLNLCFWGAQLKFSCSWFWRLFEGGGSFFVNFEPERPPQCNREQQWRERGKCQELSHSGCNSQLPPGGNMKYNFKILIQSILTRPCCLFSSSTSSTLVSISFTSFPTSSIPPSASFCVWQVLVYLWNSGLSLISKYLN